MTPYYVAGDVCCDDAASELSGCVTGTLPAQAVSRIRTAANKDISLFKNYHPYIIVGYSKGINSWNYQLKNCILQINKNVMYKHYPANRSQVFFYYFVTTKMGITNKACIQA